MTRRSRRRNHFSRCAGLVFLFGPVACGYIGMDLGESAIPLTDAAAGAPGEDRPAPPGPGGVDGSGASGVGANAALGGVTGDGGGGDVWTGGGERLALAARRLAATTQVGSTLEERLEEEASHGFPWELVGSWQLVAPSGMERLT